MNGLQWFASILAELLWFGDRFMDEYLQWLLAGLSFLLLSVWLGYRVSKHVAAKRESRRVSTEAAAQAEAQRVATDAAAHQQAKLQAATREAARAEAAKLARAKAAYAEAARLAAEEAASAAVARLGAEETARAEAARLAADEAARIEDACAAAQEAARTEAARAAAAEVRAQAARLAAKNAARAESARLAAEEATRAQAAREAAREAACLEAERQAIVIAPTPSVLRSAAKTPDQTLVMVADDSKIVRVKTGRLLAQHQYRVSFATDGLDAAQQMQTSIPDVVITDVEMPGMDGFELTRHLRQNPLTARIPVIMITAANDRHREDADRAGVSVLLGKPYAEEELIAHIRLATNRDGHMPARVLEEPVPESTAGSCN
jgi:CheY-like chemotaxis protein